jgi:hypothetical protein
MVEIFDDWDKQNQAIERSEEEVAKLRAENEALAQLAERRVEILHKVAWYVRAVAELLRDA